MPATVLRYFKLGGMQVIMKPGDGMLQIVQYLYLVCLSLTLGHFPNVVVKSSSVQSVVSETCRVQCVMEAADESVLADVGEDCQR